MTQTLALQALQVPRIGQWHRLCVMDECPRRALEIPALNVARLDALGYYLERWSHVPYASPWLSSGPEPNFSRPKKQPPGSRRDQMAEAVSPSWRWTRLTRIACHALPCFAPPSAVGVRAAIGIRQTPRVRSWTRQASYTCRYRLADIVPSRLPCRPNLVAAATAAACRRAGRNPCRSVVAVAPFLLSVRLELPRWKCSARERLPKSRSGAS